VLERLRLRPQDSARKLPAELLIKQKLDKIIAVKTIKCRIEARRRPLFHPLRPRCPGRNQTRLIPTRETLIYWEVRWRTYNFFRCHKGYVSTRTGCSSLPLFKNSLTWKVEGHAGEIPEPQQGGTLKQILGLLQHRFYFIRVAHAESYGLKRI
jgi:hypothetical protein